MATTRNIPAPRPSTRPAYSDEIYGVMAEFASVTELVSAIEKTREKGYTRIDAYSPFPSHEVIHALHLKPSPLPWIVLAGGILGLCGGYFLQIFAAVIDYPTNIGGRPLHSWPFFVPITFECTILGAALSAVFGMFALNRLPTPYHPVFNYDKFTNASRDAFFLCVEATDPKFNALEIAEFFRTLDARSVAEIDA